VRAIGLDVHLEFCEVAIAEDGEVRSAGRIETKPEQVELFARSLGSDDVVALEVTGNAWEIKRIVEPHVAEVIVVSPNDTGIRGARAKTDRLDARTLARLCAAGELDAVWMPDRETQAMRPAASAPRPAGQGPDSGQERDPRGLDAQPNRPRPVL
jgi:transposase